MPQLETKEPNLRVKQPYHKFSAQQIINALNACHGLQSLAANRLGVSLDTIRAYGKRFKAVQQAIRDSKEARLDLAEGCIIRNMLAGDTTAAIFYLKTQGKERGFAQGPVQFEVSGPGGQPIRSDVRVIQIDASEVARAIIEAERLNLIPANLAEEATEREDASILPTPAHVQTATIPEP